MSRVVQLLRLSLICVVLTGAWPSPASAQSGSFDNLFLDGGAGGEPYIRFDQSDDDDDFLVAFNHGMWFWVSDAYIFKIQQGALPDTLVLDADGVTVMGNLELASSRHLKSDIHQLSDLEAMETFSRLEPVKFRYRGAPQEQAVGFIAEDLPDLVSSRDKTGLNPMDLVAVLTKVVQNQQKEIDALKARMDNLVQAEAGR